MGGEKGRKKRKKGDREREGGRVFHINFPIKLILQLGNDIHVMYIWYMQE